VPDPLLAQLAALANTSKLISPQMKFVDIAGIIKGASAGAGLGNKFLANVKEADVLLHVVRCFDDPQVIHVESTVDPVADMKTIETELLLADLQTVEKRIENQEKEKNKHKSKADAGGAQSQVDRPALYATLRAALNAGVAVSDIAWESDAQRAEVALMQLLTHKPMAYVCNVDENSIEQHNAHSQKVFDHVAAINAAPASTIPAAGAGQPAVQVQRVPRACLRVCSQLESEVQTFDSAESRAEFLAMNSLSGTSLLPILHTANRLLKNHKFYTVGEAEARAWAIQEGALAPEAAGKIHSDLQKGFVCAEVIKPGDFIKHGGDSAARAAGCMKVEGRNYAVQDGDIIVFRVSGQKGR